MTPPPELTELGRRRREIRNQLAALDDLRPGSLTPRYRKCGKPTTYNAAIESISTRDTDYEPAPFAKRILRETRRRGFDTVPRQALLGDGAPWICNFADEHFPDAVQIVDIFQCQGPSVRGGQGHLRTRQ